jgi:predicted alpha/beta superfamily hydrolase
MLKQYVIFFCISFICAGNIYSQVNNNLSYPEVAIAGTQLRHIHSDITNEDYDLYVNLPGDYGETSKTFPVVYLIDAQWDFPLVSAIYGEQYYDGFMPAAVVVGITWSGKNPGYDSLRARDFTPTTMSQPSRFGNAPDFLKSIKNEIIPYIKKNYRVTSNRTLIGSSYGGLFTLYTLFTETNVFNQYILTSPAILFDNGVISKIEREYAEKNSKLPVRLYIAYGGYEDAASFQNFIDTLKNMNFTGLEFRSNEIEGMGHSGAKAEGFSRGLQFAFSRPTIKLSDDILKQYTGTYKLAPDIIIKIAVDNGHLLVMAPDNKKYILQAESEKDFYTKGSFNEAHFEKDTRGNVKGFVYVQYNAKNFVPKVN